MSIEMFTSLPGMIVWSSEMNYGIFVEPARVSDRRFPV